MNIFLQILATVLAQLAVALYVYGQLTERVRGHGFEIRDLKTDVRGVQVDVAGHERRISHIEGRKGISLGMSNEQSCR